MACDVWYREVGFSTAGVVNRATGRNVGQGFYMAPHNWGFGKWVQLVGPLISSYELWRRGRETFF